MRRVRAREVLAALYEGCDGLVELRSLPSGLQSFFEPADLDGMAALVKGCGEDLYFGVATRRSDASGGLENCAHLPALFVDIDREGEAIGTDNLDDLPCPPSIVINSGGGLHAYWLLREPVDLSRERDEVYRLLRGLASAVGGDPAAAEPARILRIPNTVNRKYSPARRVTVKVFEPGRRYNPSDFDWLPEAQVISGNNLDLSKPVENGKRNAALYRLGRSLRANNVPKAVIASTLLATVNDPNAFEEPLPGAEVERVINNVLRQPNRRDFDGDLTTSCNLPDRVSGADDVPADLPVVQSLSSVTRERVSWIWDRRIARRKLNITAGEPGEGKSTLTLDVTARVTRGAAWPDGGHAPQGTVLLLSAEDGLGDTIAPRLDAAGADSSQVHALTAVRSIDGKDRHLDLSRDLPQLEAAIQQVHPLLVVIDPLSAYLGKTDSWKDSEVRSLLSPLAAMADRYNCAIVGVMHLSKSSGRKALHRLLGSIGFSAAARVVLAVAADPRMTPGGSSSRSRTT